MNNIIAISKCDDTTKLQARLAQLSSANINGLSDRIAFNEDTSKYLFNMFKGVKYSDDGLKSVGVLEILPHFFYGIEDEDGKELPYSMTKRDELLDVPMMATAIAGAYLESKQGAKRKN